MSPGTQGGRITVSSAKVVKPMKQASAIAAMSFLRVMLFSLTSRISFYCGRDVNRRNKIPGFVV